MNVEKSKNLTKKQKEALDFIMQYIHENDIAPSNSEIGKALGVHSPATVHQHVTALITKGYLERGFNEHRSIRLAPSFAQFNKALLLPLAGLITAGEPIEAIEEKETTAVPADLVVSQENSYVLKVKGESMIEDGILDGDYVIVERNPSPRNGDVVVALLDNAYATLKRFFREPTRIRLEPANSSMKPFYAKDPLIQGVVRGVIRKF
jgi:repressor LexA